MKGEESQENLTHLQATAKSGFPSPLMSPMLSEDCGDLLDRIYLVFENVGGRIWFDAFSALASHLLNLYISLVILNKL